MANGPARTRLQLFLTALVATSLWFGCGPAQACNVPVYRYALERWDPDVYTAYVFHKGALTGAAAACAENLEARTRDDKAPLNLVVQRVDLAGKPDEEALKAWQDAGSPETPWLLVRFPARANFEKPAWSAPLNQPNVEALVDSPARRETARRILKGDTAVWLFLESGTKAKDDELFKMLQGQCEQLTKDLKLPPPDENAPDEGPKPNPNLKVGFSCLRIAPNDPRETFLIAVLRALEAASPAGAKEAGKAEPKAGAQAPLAAPVFGQGRLLFLLTGENVKKDGIEDAGTFLTGACSCVVKEQNPGVDLLVSADWHNLLDNPVVVDKQLPPLSGFAPAPAEELKTIQAEAPAAAPVNAPPPPAPAAGNLMLSMVIFGGVGVVVIALATVILMLARKEKV
ncbi:MAG: hypothetical protein HY291_11115 [Planctomycetes bacterium]|nr:hypothetical protein [Planctomycetota bacterium]